MLRLDKTVTRKTTLPADQDAEDWTRWQEMSFLKSAKWWNICAIRPEVFMPSVKLGINKTATETRLI